MRHRKQVNITPDPELWDRLRAEAEAGHRPLTRQLDMALADYLARIDERRQAAAAE